MPGAQRWVDEEDTDFEWVKVARKVPKKTRETGEAQQHPPKQQPWVQRTGPGKSGVRTPQP
eukprot:10942886-Alexandrium_andersonii.AAC.1